MPLYNPASSVSLAADTLWDAAGDLVQGSGANTAAKLAAGSAGYFLRAAGAAASVAWWGRAVVRKTADESVSNTSLQDDDHLTFAIAANEVWVVEYQLFGVNPANTGDIKLAVSVPASATVLIGSLGLDVGVTGVQGDMRGQALTTTGDLSQGLGGGNVCLIQMSAYVSNSTNAGSVTLRWAQNTSDGSNATTLKAGSFLIAERVA